MIRVLLVDDEPAIVETLDLALTEYGLEVRTAADGARALESIARWRPDLVLTDWMMPVMDGASLPRLLRAAPELAGIRVFMMSALQPSGYLPVDEFLQKPFGIAYLLRLIERRTGHRPSGPDLHAANSET